MNANIVNYKDSLNHQGGRHTERKPEKRLAELEH